MAGKKRQTIGKIMRERQRAEKRALKQEKKDEKKAAEVARREAEALGIPFEEPERDVDEGNLNSPRLYGAESARDTTAP